MAVVLVILTVIAGVGFTLLRMRIQTAENIVSVLRLTVEMQAHDISALRAKTEALSQVAVVEIDGASRLVQGPHDHVFGSVPMTADTSSQTFKCQVPYCDRVQTQVR
jgi:hypothetical protein